MKRELQAMGAAATQIEPGQSVLGAGLYRLAVKLKHPRVFDEDAPLGRGRTVLAVLIILIFVLSFIPDPVKGTSLLALLKQAGTVVK